MIILKVKVNLRKKKKVHNVDFSFANSIRLADNC